MVIPFLRNRDRELQIKLTELEIKIQRKTTEHSLYLSVVLSSMIVITFTCYTWALTQTDINFLYAGLVTAFFLLGLDLVLNRYFLKQLDELEAQIPELMKEYASDF